MLRVFCRAGVEVRFRAAAGKNSICGRLAAVTGAGNCKSEKSEWNRVITPLVPFGAEGVFFLEG